MTVLDEYAFKLNGYLTRAIVPSGVAEIPTGVFRACQNLKCVVLSDSVTGIADGAFYECPALAEVFYAGTAEAWAQIRKGGLNQALENAGLVCLGDARVLSIPAHIREIQSEAFLNLTAADAIRIPEGEIAIAADFADAGTVLIVPSQEWAQWAQWAETNGYRWVSWPEENP